jgi:hypothetical protein
VEALQKKGYIKREHASRGIKLVTEPPLEINMVKVIGSFSESGKIVPIKKEKFIPIPDRNSDLVSVIGEVNIPDVGALKGDYVIFEKSATRNGLTLVKIGNEILVGILKNDNFEDLSKNKHEKFNVVGTFYGILRIPEGREYDE